MVQHFQSDRIIKMSDLERETMLAFYDVGNLFLS